MSAQHTPGPWTVRKQSNTIAAFDRVVADANGMTPADARLIAAAPDLLAACKAFMADHDNTYDGEGMSLERYTAINMIDAAIAKAEGRS